MSSASSIESDSNDPEAEKPRVSVVIATHNRAPYLRKALTSLAGQTLAIAEREIIVVLSACSDESRSVLEAEFGELPGLRVFEEPMPGVSLARNLGIREARGEIIAFLDDDAVAPESWLEALLYKFESASSSIAACGGPVSPIWEAKRPEWLPSSLEQFLTIVDLGPSDRLLGAFEYLVGANMAYRTSLLRQIGGFPANLDRVGTKLLSNGDLYPQDILRTQGHGILYAPKVFVRHHVMANRLSAEWFWERGFWQGYSDWIMGLRLNSDKQWIRVRRLLRAFSRILANPLDFARLIGGPNHAKIESQFRARWLLGYVAACLSQTGESNEG